MRSPEDSEDQAHLGPSGRGLRSRGRRNEERERKWKGSRGGEKGRKQTAQVSNSRHIKLEITDKRTKWVDETVDETWNIKQHLHYCHVTDLCPIVFLLVSRASSLSPM